MKLREKLSRKLRKSKGFTLIEMLVVIAIIAILVVVSVPMVNSSLTKAKNATDDANERAAKAAALISYMTDDTVDGTSEVNYYYNADTGEAQKGSSAGITPYNQTKHDPVPAGEGCVKVTINADGTLKEVAWEDIK